MGSAVESLAPVTDPIMVKLHFSTDVVHDPKTHFALNLGHLQAPVHS